jgi:hypothetical protein
MCFFAGYALELDNLLLKERQRARRTDSRHGRGCQTEAHPRSLGALGLCMSLDQGLVGGGEGLSSSIWFTPPWPWLLCLVQAQREEREVTCCQSPGRSFGNTCLQAIKRRNGHLLPLV